MKRLIPLLSCLALVGAGRAVTLDDLQANPVPALGQNAEDVRVFDPAKGPRVLFVGNSITLHGPRPEIGWTNNWGMAASAMEKDYVHLVRERLLALQPDTQCCLLQVADTFERSFFRADWRPEDHFAWAREFKPDIVLFFFGANVPGEYDSGTLDPAAAQSFGEALEALRDYLDTGTTRFFVSQGFYIRPVLDDEKRALCHRRGDTFIDIGNIRSRLDTHGMFNHPDDRGMALLAERFAEAMKRSGALGPETRMTPTMGWSSWNGFHSDISDTLIVSQAEALVSTGLADCGYDHVNIDDGWFGGRDENGHLFAYAKRFPNGLKPVVERIHSLGLKAGTYSDAGESTCSKVCGGDPLGTGVGLYRHDAEDVDFLFAENGFDFIKVDYCGGLPIGNGEKVNLGERRRYEAIRRALDEAGFSHVGMNVCRWDYPGTWVHDIADSWRVTPDINESWESTRSIIAESLFLGPYASGGHFNDLDMLEVGRGMTFEEDRTQFAMWCVLASPLLIGCDLTTIAPETLALLTNRELIAVDQDPLGRPAMVVRQIGPEDYILVRDLGTAGGTTRCLAFYAGGKGRSFSIDFADIDLGGKVRVRELVEGRDLGECEGAITCDVPDHGTRVFRLEGERRLERTEYPAHWAYLSAFQEISSEDHTSACYLHTMLSDRGWWHPACAVGGRADDYLLWRDVLSLDGGDYVLSFDTFGDGAGFDVDVNGERIGFCRPGETILATLKKGMNTVRLGNDTEKIGTILSLRLAKE